MSEARPALPGWFSIAVGFTATFATSGAARAAGLHGRFAALTVLAVAAACCVRATLGSAVFVGGLGWAFATGFLVNQLGLLTFHRPDLMLLVTAVAGSLAVCIGSGLRRVRVVRSHHRSHLEESHRG